MQIIHSFMQPTTLYFFIFTRLSLSQQFDIWHMEPLKEVNCSKFLRMFEGSSFNDVYINLHVYIQNQHGPI